MNLITIEDLTKGYSEKNLIDNISLNINEGDKIGLIGVNGTGKSTLLKIIVGLEYADSGNVSKASNFRIEYLSQNPEFNLESTVLEHVFKGNTPEIKLIRKYEETLQKMTDGDTSYNDKLLELQVKIDNLNLWNIESEAKTILTKLKITNFNAKLGILSGGQRKRIALASALITPCDLLVLDEPTNHMDSESIVWLEEYLNSRKGALLMITHDRYFLDRVTNKIIELYNGKIYSYEGNYSVYIEKKIERENLEAAVQSKKYNLFKKELAWIKRGAKARTTKQKARIQRFEKLKDQIIVSKDQNLELTPISSRLGKKIIEIKNLSKSFDSIQCIKDFNYTLLRDDRIGIVGPNGSGKSTLMKIINGDIKADEGEIDIGETVKIGFFSQENHYMDENIRVIDYIKEIGEYLPLPNGDSISASKMLERFLFSPDLQYNLIGKLSGGERRRLYLLSILMTAPNVLLFDEPTNDLDITTLRILEDFLDDFNGPVIVISHDRYFLDRICEKIFSYEGSGKIVRYNGNYSDYLSSCQQKKILIDKNKDENSPKKIEHKRKNKDRPLKFTFKEQKEFSEIDRIIDELETKIKTIEKTMEQYPSDFVKIQELLTEKEGVEVLLEEKYERWTYLNELAEKIDELKK